MKDNNFIKKSLPVIIWGLFTLAMIVIAQLFNSYNTLSFTEIIKRGNFVSVILFASSVYSFFIFKNEKQKLINGKIKRVIITLLMGIVIDFCFFGKSLLFSKDGLWFVSDRLHTFMFMYIISIAYFMISEIALLKASVLFSNASEEIDNSKLRIHTVIIFVFQLIVFGLYLYSFNPGNMSYDSFAQVGEIKGLTMISTWHPIGHTLFLGLLLKIWDNMLIVGIFHVLMASLVITQWFYLLLKKGIKPSFVYIVFLIIILSPSTGINVVTQWKDIPFTLSLMWATSILFRMIDKRTFFNKWYELTEFLIASLMIGLFRHNGILAFIGIMIFSISYIIKNRKQINVYASSTVIVLTVSVVVFINGILPNMIETNHNPPGMKLRPVFQGLGAVYVKGDEDNYSPKTRETIEAIASPENMVKFYQPYFADIYSNNLPELIERLSMYSTRDVLSMYIEAAEHNPEVIFADKFNLAIGMWSVTQDRFSYNNRYTTQIDKTMQDNFGVKRLENNIEPALTNYVGATSKEAKDWTQPIRSILDTIFWRTGIYTVLSISLLIFLMNINKKYFNIFIPMIGNYFIVFLTMPAQDFRYFWFMLLIFPMLLMSSYVYIRDRKKEEMEVN